MGDTIRKQILLIEPNPKMRELILSSLSNPDLYNIHLSESLLNAERILSGRNFDLIICELIVNGKSILPFIHQIKGFSKHAKVKFIIVSQHSQIENRLKAFRCGASDFIAKPFHPEELVARVNGVLEINENKDHLQSAESIINLDEYRREMEINRIKVKLTVTEFQIIYYMIQNRSFCEHDSLMKFLVTQKGKDLKWGAIRVSITRLRNKLWRSTGMKVIKNRHGQGYYLAV